MNMKALVVGQDVSIRSGCYGHEGKVVKVTSDGVWVDLHNNPPKLDPISPGVYYFDTNGKGLAHQGTYECGPWFLEGSPAEERETLVEQGGKA